MLETIQLATEEFIDLREVMKVSIVKVFGGDSCIDLPGGRGARGQALSQQVFDYQDTSLSEPMNANQLQ